MSEIRKFLDEMRQTNAKLKTTVDELERKQNEEIDQLRTQLQAANERIHDLMLFVKDVDARCRRAHAKDVEFNDIGLWDLAKAELEKETP